MGAEYISVTLPGGVKEQMDALTVGELVSALKQTDISRENVTDCWDKKLDSRRDMEEVLEILRDSVSDLRRWPKSSVRGVEFYQMGGETWGDDPYEGFTEHLMVQEIMTVLGKL